MARRWLTITLALGAAVLAGCGYVGNDPGREIARGDAARCLDLRGDAARGCYSREVGRQLAALAGRDVGDVEAIQFTTVADDGADLLCDLHARVGDVGAATPARVGWSQPLS
jgi:hypothetical protein